jgi:hypothetical protein
VRAIFSIFGVVYVCADANPQSLWACDGHILNAQLQCNGGPVTRTFFVTTHHE